MKYGLLVGSVGLLIGCTSVHAGQKHWVVIPTIMQGLHGDTPRILYFDKNSIKPRNKEGIAYADFKMSFGTPPNQVEEMYFYGTLKMNCNTGEITNDKLSIYLKDYPKKHLEQTSDDNNMGVYDRNKPTERFNYVFTQVCKPKPA